MQCSGLQVGAFLVLLAGTILVAISIGTSSWSSRTLGGTASVAGAEVGGTVVLERGLWYECQRSKGGINPDSSDSAFALRHDNCQNRYESFMKKAKEVESGEDVKNLFKELRAWEVAVLALMCGSGFFGILSLLFSPCCCNRCGCCLATVIFFAAALCASAVCTYAYYVAAGESHDGWEIKVNEFGWSYWCGVAGGACQLLSGILFAVSRCRQHSYSHTI